MKFEWEMDGYKDDGVIPPDKYLRAIMVLLTGAAAAWSETNREVAGWLLDPNPTAATVEAFKARFTQKYPARTVETVPINYSAEILNLKQGRVESLLEYYQQALEALQGFSGRDCLGPGLTPIEASTLDMVVRTFIRGIADKDMMKETMQGMSIQGRSLVEAYQHAEDARVSKAEYEEAKAEEDKQKMLEAYKKSEAEKEKELEYLRRLLDQHMTPSRVEAFKSGYSNPNASGGQWDRQAYPPQSSSQPSRPTYDYYRQPASYNQPYHQHGQQGSGYPFQLNQAPLGERQPSADHRPPVTYNTNRQSYGQRTKMDPMNSTNGYVNGSQAWRREEGPLCFKCGIIGHMSPVCANPPLQYWEQEILRGKIFGDRPRPPPRPYTAPSMPVAGPPNETMAGAPVMSAASSEALHTPSTTVMGSNLVSLGYQEPQVASLDGNYTTVDRNRSAPPPPVQSFLGEGSGPNKRARPGTPINEPPSTSSQPPEVPLMGQAGPSDDTQGTDSTYKSPYPFVFDVPGARKKKAMKKGARKKNSGTTPMNPLVGMVNEETGVAKGVISVREVMEKAPISLSLMDLCFWSPMFTRELKRLTTRVSKKKK